MSQWPRDFPTSRNHFVGSSLGRQPPGRGWALDFNSFIGNLSQEPEGLGSGAALHHQWPNEQSRWWLHEVLQSKSLMEKHLASGGQER